MKQLLVFLISAMAWLMPCGMKAQIYVVDNWIADSAQIYQIVLNEDKTIETAGEEAGVKLPAGERVEVVRSTLTKKSGVGDPVIKIKGKEYIIYAGDILFSDENPEGTVDPFNTAELKSHSATARFFSHMFPYYVVFLIYLAAGIFTLIGLKCPGQRKLSLVAIAACLAVGSVLEIVIFSLMGSDAFWWCDAERYGFWGGFFRALPFFAMVAFQIYSYKLYKKILIPMEKHLEDPLADISIKPMVYGFALSLPLAFISSFVPTWMGIHNTTLSGAIFIVVFIVATIGGCMYATRKNIKKLGKRTGLMFSVFEIIYVIGTLVAVWAMILLIVKLLFQVIIFVAGMIAIAFFGGEADEEKGKSGLFVDHKAEAKRTQERQAKNARDMYN